jgi:TRAP-type mannitol/chloroaromatic compound transport system permease small subunit
MNMQGLLGFSRAVDAMNRWIGQIVAWGILAAVLVSAINAIIRKVFNTSSNAWLELQWVLFGAVFLLCCSWTLMSNEHIRIDVVANFFSRKLKNIIDVIGHALFLLPLTMIMMYYSWPFFFRSLAQWEQSSNAGGLPQYPAKFLVPLGFTLLFFQGLSELIKRIAIMRGELEDISGGGHHEAAEAEAQRLRETLAAEAEARARAEAERLKRQSS